MQQVDPQQRLSQALGFLCWHFQLAVSGVWALKVVAENTKYPSLRDYFLPPGKRVWSAGSVPHPRMPVQTVMDKVSEGVRVEGATVLT